MPEKQKIALVLSSGGARGNAHIGAIQEIIHRGYEISSISGTSMGAVIGGVYAAGKLDEFSDWMCSLHKLDVFSLMDFTLNKKGFVKADRVFNEIKKIIPDVQIENLQIPFVAIATDLKKREIVVLNKGSLFNALRASVAIPAIITPIISSGQFLVDGGLLSPIPIEFVERNKNDILVVVNVNAQIPFINMKAKKSEKVVNNNGASKFLQMFSDRISKITNSNKKETLGFFDLITNSSNLMLSQISKLLIDLYPPEILINISSEACDTYDFYKASEMIDVGKKAAADSLDRFEKIK
jgi:NTE family protein